MQKILKLLLAIALFLGCVVSAITAQESIVGEDDPSWLILERGRLAFASREYGEALRLFRAVKDANSTMPEVDIEIGHVFEAEGEMELALLQYERAYEQKALLMVPDDAIDLLYRIASIRKTRGELLQYEELLTTIAETVDSRYPQPPTQLTEPMYRVLTTNGLDKLLELYRIDDLGSQQAYHLLSRTLLYDGRRFIEASKYAAFSVIMTITELISYAIYIDPEYEFHGIESLIYTTDRFRTVVEYIDRTALFDQLLVLGQSLYSSDRFATAEQIRNLLVRTDPVGAVGIRAARGYTTL
jgi:tetratricopeptide (TPR) repeat protein